MNFDLARLCSGCRVQPSTTYVGAFPVCGMCLGNVRLQVPQAHVTVQRADPYDFVGKQYGWEIVGQTAPLPLWNSPYAYIAGILALGLGLLVYGKNIR